MSDDLGFRSPLDEHAGPAVPISDERAAALIAAALDEASRSEKRGPTLRPRRRVWIVALAAALLLVIGSALAALRVLRSVPPPSQPITALPEPTPTIASTGIPTAEVTASAEPEPAVTASAIKQGFPSQPVLPVDLLRAANEQRTQHKWQEAEATYERVAMTAPHSVEAYTATVAAASIRLEHLHDARGALRSYQAALSERPNGALSEEARWGIAQARRALGDRQGEIDALRAFVASHPDAIRRPNAEERLKTLLAM